MTSEKKRTPQTADKFILRLPDGMRDRIAESAKRHGRSMNAEIVHVLQSFYDLSDPDDYPYDEYEESQIGVVDHFAPKAALSEASRTRNLFISHSKDNKLLASLLRQQLELMNKIVGSQSAPPVAEADTVEANKEPVANAPTRAKRTPPKSKA